MALNEKTREISKMAYFLSNVEPNNPSSTQAAPNVSGKYVQDFTALKTDISTTIQKTNYDTKISHVGTTFLLKELFTNERPPYQVFISYKDKNNNVYSMNLQAPEPILLPWRATENSFQEIPLYLNGDPTQPTKYSVDQQFFGSYTIQIKPTTTIVANDVPQKIQIDLNVNLATLPGETGNTLKTFYFTSFIENNSIYPSSTQAVVSLDLPYWLRLPYWIQQIFATQNLKDLPPAIGYPYNLIPLRPSFTQSSQALTSYQVNEIPEGVPEAFYQVELSILDQSYVGNSTNGRILATGIFSPLKANTIAMREFPRFLEQTTQPSSSFAGTSFFQYSITDRTGSPFLSLLATYDIITQALIKIIY